MIKIIRESTIVIFLIILLVSILYYIQKVQDSRIGEVRFLEPLPTHFYGQKVAYRLSGDSRFYTTCNHLGIVRGFKKDYAIDYVNNKKVYGYIYLIEIYCKGRTVDIEIPDFDINKNTD